MTSVAAVAAAVGALVVCVTLAITVRTVLLVVILHLAAYRQVQRGARSAQLGQVEGIDAKQVADGQGVRCLAEGHERALRDGDQMIHPLDGVHGVLQLAGTYCIDLVQQHLVRVGHLLRGLVHSPLGTLARQLFDEVDSVDDSYHAIDFTNAPDVVVAVEGLADRPRVRHARGLDEDAVEAPAARDLALLVPRRLDDAFDRIDQVAPDSAAQATILQQGDAFFRLFVVALQEELVYPHGADLILDDRVPPPVVGIEDVVQQRGLARAEEARQDCHRNFAFRKNTCSCPDDLVVVQRRENQAAYVELDLVGHVRPRREAGLTVP
mmetsp:Transcript_38525/g.116477  ORF Transcript_38525/g.116477 Transcript_38525/m.116477 type:complete len:323 (-) Transcript_38525:120-1088(-)